MHGKDKTKINISIEMPSKVQDEYKHRSLHEKVLDYMDVCESDEDSYYHWNYLKCLYNKLHKMKCLPEKYVEILEDLEGFMSKHAMYDSGENQAEITARNIFKYREEA